MKHFVESAAKKLIVPCPIKLHVLSPALTTQLLAL